MYNSIKFKVYEIIKFELGLRLRSTGDFKYPLTLVMWMKMNLLILLHFRHIIIIANKNAASRVR